MQNSGKQTKKELIAEIFRFLLVGGGATLADYLVFWLFDAWLMPLCFPQEGIFVALGLSISVALGFCVGLVFNWIFSVVFVFKRTREQIKISSKKHFWTFTIIGVIGLIVSEAGMFLLVLALPEISIAGSATLLGTAWEKWIAKAVLTCIVLIWNYLARKRWIFKS